MTFYHRITRWTTLAATILHLRQTLNIRKLIHRTLTNSFSNKPPWYSTSWTAETSIHNSQFNRIHQICPHTSRRRKEGGLGGGSQRRRKEGRLGGGSRRGQGCTKRLTNRRSSLLAEARGASKLLITRWSITLTLLQSCVSCAPFVFLGLRPFRAFRLRHFPRIGSKCDFFSS